MEEEKKPLLEVSNLKQYFRVSRNYQVKAVDGVSFQIFPGETYGLVGESGSGKSTIGRSLIRLYKPTSGEVKFKGVTISGNLTGEETKHLRTKMQMIFQDPMACLNPRKKVLDIVAQGLDLHGMCHSSKEREEKVYSILKMVGLSKEHATRYPHQFSDLSMVKYISDRIGVLHLGHLVETGTTEEIFENPIHPYTRSLLSAIPQPDPIGEKKRVALSYDYGEMGIDYKAGTSHFIQGQHYVLGTEDEIKSWSKKA